VDGVINNPPVTGYGYTDDNGNVKVTITKDSSGIVNLAASTVSSCDTSRTVGNIDIPFYDNSSVFDWPMFMHDPQHASMSQFTDPVITESLNEGTANYWSATLPTAQTTYFDYPLYDSSPAVHAGVVVVGAYTSDSVGSVQAFDGINGTQIWSTNNRVAMGGIVSSSAIYDEKVYVGSIDGKVYCLSFSDGSLIWSAQAYESNTPTGYRKIYGSPVVYNGAVYIGTAASMVYAFDAVSGARISGWSTPIYLGTDRSNNSTSSPSIAHTATGDYLFIGCNNNYIYRINLTTRDCASLNLGAPVESSPTVADGYVYVGCSRVGSLTAHNLYKLSIEPFAISTSTYLMAEVRTSPAYASGQLYTGCDTGTRFYQHLASDLSLISSFDAIGDPKYFMGSAALTNAGSAPGIVYVGDDDQRLYARDATDVSQAKATTSRTGGYIRSTPAIAYINDSNDKLYRWVFITTRANGGKLLAFKKLLN
jgi:outer membrane protein assembly factor BamB